MKLKSILLVFLTVTASISAKPILQEHLLKLKKTLLSHLISKLPILASGVSNEHDSTIISEPETIVPELPSVEVEIPSFEVEPSPIVVAPPPVVVAPPPVIVAGPPPVIAPAPTVIAPPSIEVEAPALEIEDTPPLIEVDHSNVPTIVSQVPTIIGQVPSIIGQIPPIISEIGSVVSQVPSIDLPSVEVQVPTGGVSISGEIGAQAIEVGLPTGSITVGGEGAALIGGEIISSPIAATGLGGSVVVDDIGLLDTRILSYGNEVLHSRPTVITQPKTLITSPLSTTTFVKQPQIYGINNKFVKPIVVKDIGVKGIVHGSGGTKILETPNSYGSHTVIEGPSGKIIHSEANSTPLKEIRTSTW